MSRDELTYHYLSAAVIVGLGTLLVIPLLGDWIEVGAPITDLGVTKLLLPLSYFGVLLGYVRWRFTKDDDDIAMPRIAAWFLLGVLLTPLLVWFSLVGREVTFTDMIHIVNRAALRGGVVFLLIGHYSASNHAAREQLVQRTEQLEFVNRLLRHDVRNDVTAILGYAEMLADQYRNERIAEDVAGDPVPLERIEERARHISELSNMASHIEAGEGFTEQRVQLTELLETEIDRVRTEFPEAEFSFVPDEERAVTVVADESLRAVFDNLLHNAVQHNDQSTPRVTVTTEVEPETVVVRVADSGSGISKSMRATLFDPGKKGPDSAGTGLGLYLVQSLVDRYDGEIWIEANETRGTVFAVELNRPTEPVDGAS